MARHAERVIGPDADIKYYLNSYNIPSAVMELQEQNTTDFLLVGVNSKTGIERLMMSSTALELAENVDSIIIALPAAIGDFGFNTLHLAVKHAYPVDEARFEELLSVAPGKIDYITFFSVLRHDEARDEVIPIIPGSLLSISWYFLKFFSSRVTVKLFQRMIYRSVFLAFLRLAQKIFCQLG